MEEHIVHVVDRVFDSMERILIIEDEKDVNQLLAQNLQNNGYETVSVWNGLDGVRQLQNQHFDMVLLDLMLPYKSGDEILREIRKDSDIPVIVISAKDLVGTKIDLLTLGADDYITKPFDLGEVTARVVSNLRRYHMKDQKKQLSYKELTLDTESKTLTVNGAELELTAKEYGIMELLLQSPNKVFSKAYLYETVWGYEYLGDENVIKTHISNLRTKMKTHSETEYIETVSISMGIKSCQSAPASGKDIRPDWKKRRRKDNTDADDRGAWIPDTGQHSIIRR